MKSHALKLLLRLLYLFYTGASYSDVRRLQDWIRTFSPRIRPVHNQSEVMEVDVWMNVTLIQDLVRPLSLW